MGRIRKIAFGAASSAAMGLLFIATPSIAQTRPPIMGKPIPKPATVNPLSLITNSLSCDEGQTKHKELKSGVAIHVTPAQIFANGNGLLASIHRTFFFAHPCHPPASQRRDCIYTHNPNRHFNQILFPMI